MHTGARLSPESSCRPLVVVDTWTTDQPLFAGDGRSGCSASELTYSNHMPHVLWAA